MNNAVIASYVRSPFTPATKGDLARVRADEITAQVLRALVKKSGIDAADLEALYLGCAFPEGEQGMNLARLIVFLADLPHSVAGVTVNQFCGSSMQAIHMAAGAIAIGAGEAYLCAGVESMSRVPMMGFNPMPHPGLAKDYPQAYVDMGETAEILGEREDISREAQEVFAASSQQKAAAAQSAGYLDDEVVPIEGPGGSVSADQCLRPETTPEVLAGLKPAFRKQGRVTAGTSSPLTDGAAAVLVCSEDYASRNGLKPLARIVATAVAGCEPEIMGIGPVWATRKALKRAGLEVADIGIWELNEAFSSQALACINTLKLDESRVNLDGGAIALGHPLGATGARITGKVAALLQREGKRYGIATQCIGGGQGIATVLERY